MIMNGEKQKKSRFVRCPLCGKKTRTKVYEETVLLHFPLFCPKCDNEVMVDVMKFVMKKSTEPGA